AADPPHLPRRRAARRHRVPRGEHRRVRPARVGPRRPRPRLVLLRQPGRARGCRAGLPERARRAHRAHGRGGLRRAGPSLRGAPGARGGRHVEHAGRAPLAGGAEPAAAARPPGDPGGTGVNLPDLVRAELAPELGHGVLSTDPDVVGAHSTDQALFCPSDGAVGLVRARSVADVQATLRFATRHRVPVVPQGARTGLSGGANAVPGCLLLSVERMDRVLGVDPAERTVTVEPGIINADLKSAVAEHGLSYPPDPGSVAISSIGGNVATNAGGLCCVRYGVTRDYVRRLRVVLADGTLTTLGTTTAKRVPGLDLSSLLVG